MLKISKQVFAGLRRFLGSVYAALFFLTTGIVITSFFLIVTIIDAVSMLLTLTAANTEVLLASVDRLLFLRVQMLRASVFSWRVRLTLSRLRKSVLKSPSVAQEVLPTSPTPGLSIVSISEELPESSESPTGTPPGRGPVWH